MSISQVSFYLAFNNAQCSLYPWKLLPFTSGALHSLGFLFTFLAFPSFCLIFFYMFLDIFFFHIAQTSSLLLHVLWAKSFTLSIPATGWRFPNQISCVNTRQNSFICHQNSIMCVGTISLLNRSRIKFSIFTAILSLYLLILVNGIIFYQDEKSPPTF